MLLHDGGRVLHGVACLLVAPCLPEVCVARDITRIVWTVGQQALDSAAAGVRIADPITQDVAYIG